jgi:hypothetical protein
MRVGYLVQNYYQGISPGACWGGIIPVIAKAGKKFFQRSVTVAPRSVFHLQGNAPVIRGDAVQIEGSHPVHPDLMRRRQGGKSPGPGTCLCDKEGPRRDARADPFFNSMKSC